MSEFANEVHSWHLLFMCSECFASHKCKFDVKSPLCVHLVIIVPTLDSMSLIEIIFITSRSTFANSGHTTDPTDRIPIGRRDVVSVAVEQSASDHNSDLEHEPTANAKSITVSGSASTDADSDQQSLADRDYASVEPSTHHFDRSGLRSSEWWQSGKPKHSTICH